MDGPVTASPAELPESGELSIETGLTYDGVAPVRVRVSSRQGRYKVTDDGRAVVAAAAPRRVAFPTQIVLDEHSVNVTRHGTVWLPAVAPSDEWLRSICELVARGSVALYEQLLELDDEDA